MNAAFGSRECERAKTFGVSSNLRTICSACGADKFSKFFDIKIKDHLWNLMFILGASVGGFIALNYLSKNTHVEISENTKTILELYNINSFESDYLPLEIFALESLNLNNITLHLKILTLYLMIQRKLQIKV